jgi:phospholipid transport system substrate-binding protein
MVSRRLVLVFGFVLLTAGMPLALAAGEATAVVIDFGNRALQMLNDPQLSPAERQKRFAALLDQDFDFVKIGRFVLGRYWQSATNQERQEFAPVFHDYLVQSYSVFFNEFTGTSFKVTGERPEGSGSTLVSTTVIQRGNPTPAKVDGRVSMDTGSPKITDVIIEGISMSLTYRQEFASVIERSGGGVSGLIAQLRAKANIAKP